MNKLFFILFFTFVQFINSQETAQNATKELWDPSQGHQPIDTSGDGVCGDNQISIYNEECDNSEGCGSDCFCMTGYTLNKTSHFCLKDCVYGDQCIYGCTEPNKCEKCNTTKYTEDCQSCQEGYMWLGEGNCVEITNTTQYPKYTCQQFFDYFLEDKYANGTNITYSAGFKYADHAKNFSIVLDEKTTSFSQIYFRHQVEGVFTYGIVPLMQDSFSRNKKPTDDYQIGFYVRFENNKTVESGDFQGQA